jgi:flagellar basal-body rod protein FlgB
MNPLFNTVDRLEKTLDFHRDRHSVIAGNLSNVDTPGYRPVDLAEADDGKGEARLFTDTTTEPGADGNAVSLERELAKIDANRVRYNTTSEVVSRRLALLRYAVTDGNG